MNDALDLRLAPLARLRAATAQLLAAAEVALDAGDPAQDDACIDRLRHQLASFDRQLQRSRRLLSRCPSP
jgi:hypothetical protein